MKIISRPTRTKYAGGRSYDTLSHDTIELLKDPLREKGVSTLADERGAKQAMESVKEVAAGSGEFWAFLAKAIPRNVPRPVKGRTESLAKDEEAVLDLVEEMFRNMELEGLEQGDTPGQMMVRFGEVRLPLRRQRL